MRKPNRRAHLFKLKPQPQPENEPIRPDDTAHDLRGRLAVDMIAQGHYRIADALDHSVIFYNDENGALMLIGAHCYHALHVNDFRRIETCIAGLVKNPSFRIEVFYTHEGETKHACIFKDGNYIELIRP